MEVAAMSSQTADKTATVTGTEETKFFLDYLDHEIASLQILIVFTSSSLTVALGIIVGIGRNAALHMSLNSPTDMVRSFVAGGLLLLAMGLFFVQRSALGWLYGQASMAAAGYENAWTFSEILQEADSWTIWLKYRWAWTSLLGAYMEAGSIIFRGLAKTGPWDSPLMYGIDAIFVAMLIWRAVQTYAFAKLPYSSSNPVYEYIQRLREGK
jgi:hypothetical protein